MYPADSCTLLITPVYHWLYALTLSIIYRFIIFFILHRLLEYSSILLFVTNAITSFQRPSPSAVNVVYIPTFHLQRCCLYYAVLHSCIVSFSTLDTRAC